MNQSKMQLQSLLHMDRCKDGHNVRKHILLHGCLKKAFLLVSELQEMKTLKKPWRYASE